MKPLCMTKFKQLVLIVLDGLGVASPSEGNAVYAANPRNLNYLINHYPTTTLQASGPSVGLPWGEQGNSEVGHLNLGAGRIVGLDLPRISQTIRNGEFFRNKVFLSAMEHVKKNHSKLHMLGLVSSGGVHSSEEHLHALLALAAGQGVEKVFVHMFTDGRDASPKSALGSLDKLTRKFFESGVGKIGSISGRFFAMDRGRHWEVTEKVYQMLVLGEGAYATSVRQAIQDYYAMGIYDEMIPPTVIAPKREPLAKIEAGDAVIFFNFRPDRIYQLAESIVDPSFDKFSQKYPAISNLYCATMTQYKKDSRAQVAFPPIEIKHGLSEVLSVHNLRQFHIAESEKYAHVTSFFNGGRIDPWPGEEREIITSPATYQKRYQDVPEMSVGKIGEKMVEKLREGTNFILANFANPDMVGHTGNQSACIKAVLAIDKIIGLVFEEALKLDACLMVTADHGNIEENIDIITGMVDTEHSLNPVPLIVTGSSLGRKAIKAKGYAELASTVPEGVLSDVAPTILDLLGIPKPPEMTAASLLPILLKQIQ